MWIERGSNLITGLALLVVISGLLVLALPESKEGTELIQLDAAHRLTVADFVGATMVAVGALLIWVTILVWQRKRIQISRIDR